MITKYLPEFKVFEVGSLTGLRAGHMVSQQPAAASIAKKAVGENNFIENGIIMGLNVDGELDIWGKEGVQGTMFVHYTEELNTFIDELKYFAVPVEKKYDPETRKMVDDFASTYPRGIALYAGDSFCTNNVVEAVDAKYAKVENGILTLQATADSDTHFSVKESTLPTGEKAYDFVYIG
jgi:hypothetical protein